MLYLPMPWRYLIAWIVVALDLLLGVLLWFGLLGDPAFWRDLWHSLHAPAAWAVERLPESLPHTGWIYLAASLLQDFLAGWLVGLGLDLTGWVGDRLGSREKEDEEEDEEHRDLRIASRVMERLEKKAKKDKQEGDGEKAKP